MAGRYLADLEISPGTGQPVPQRSRPRQRPERPARQDHLGQDQERHRDQQRDPELHGGDQQHCSRAQVSPALNGEAEDQPGRRPGQTGEHSAQHTELQAEQAPCAHGEPQKEQAAGDYGDDDVQSGVDLSTSIGSLGRTPRSRGAGNPKDLLLLILLQPAAPGEAATAIAGQGAAGSTGSRALFAYTTTTGPRRCTAQTPFTIETWEEQTRLEADDLRIYSTHLTKRFWLDRARAVDGAAVVIGHLPAGLRPGRLGPAAGPSD